MNLIEAIKAKNKEAVTEVIKRACDRYNAECPKEPVVGSAYGDVKVSMLLDDESKWEVATAAAMNIVRASDNISKDLDKQTEIAKLIATDAVLRNIFSEATSNGDFL